MIVCFTVRGHAAAAAAVRGPTAIADVNPVRVITTAAMATVLRRQLSMSCQRTATAAG
jgi:hypothetical protein